MNISLSARIIICVLSFVVVPQLLAQTSNSELTKSADANSKASKNDDKKATDVKAQRLDADLNDDGIIDAVQSLPSLNSVSATATKQSSDTALQTDLAAGFHKAQQVQRTPKRNSCFDYLMLSPEEKDRVNQRVQQQTTGVFGTRPCDPFVSPDLERPFDNDYIEVPLLPRSSIVVPNVVLRN